EFHGTLIADARGPGDVVNGVSPQRHHIHYSFRGHPQDLFDLGRVANQVVFGRIQNADLVVNQLKHVLVAGDDIHRVGAVGRLLRQSSNHVIGFVAFRLKNGDSVGVEGATDIGQLLDQVAGHLRTVRLVAAISHLLESLCLDVKLPDGRNGSRLLVAKRRRAYVEYRSQVLGREIVAQLAEHVYENVCGSRGYPGLG